MKMHELSKESAAVRFFKLEKAFEQNDTSDLGPLTVIKEDGIYGWGDLVYRPAKPLTSISITQGLDEDSTGGSIRMLLRILRVTGTARVIWAGLD